MSRPILHREVTDLELRSDGRTLFGRIVPYGEIAEVADSAGRPYRERFVPGAFARSIAQRAEKVRLLVNHEHRTRLPIGRAVNLSEADDGLHGEFHVSATRDADEVLELVRDGVLDAFSVGFSPVRDRKASDGTVERVEASIRECSVVSFPAYAGAAIAGLRSLTSDASLDLRARFLELKETHHG